MLSELLHKTFPSFPMFNLGSRLGLGFKIRTRFRVLVRVRIKDMVSVKILLGLGYGSILYVKIVYY